MSTAMKIDCHTLNTRLYSFTRRRYTKKGPCRIGGAVLAANRPGARNSVVATALSLLSRDRRTV